MSILKRIIKFVFMKKSAYILTILYQRQDGNDAYDTESGCYVGVLGHYGYRHILITRCNDLGIDPAKTIVLYFVWLKK